MSFLRTLHPRIRHGFQTYTSPGHHFARHNVARTWLIAALLLLTSGLGAVSAIASAPDAVHQLTGRLPNATVFVFLDLDEDGNKLPSESGIGGVTVTLIDENGNVISTQVTGSDGSIGFPEQFVDLDTDYFLVLTVPEGYTNTSPTSVQILPSEDGSIVVEFGLKLLGHELFAPTLSRD